MSKVYIETSVVSHATAWPSNDPETLILQQQAKQWFDDVAPKYELVTSQFVIDEASLGDPDAAADRLELLAAIPVLMPDERVEELSNELISRSIMPEKARLDALHIASAAIGGIEYLLTQNCRHIANAHTLPRVYDLLEEFGYESTLICTPAEFLGDIENGP